MLQVYVVTTPADDPDVEEEQLSGAPVPLMFQTTPPFESVGATVPAVPVTVAVKVIVDPNEPPPLEVSTTVGATLGITTVVVGVAERAV